jgi:hypothetical protein
VATAIRLAEHSDRWGALMAFILAIIQFISSSAFQAIAGGVVSVLNKRSDVALGELQSTVGAERDTLIARIQADAAGYQTRSGLMKGMWWLSFALFLAYFGPLWHSLLVYLDSCPFIPWFDGWIPAIIPHPVGSWKVAALPGLYGDHEWQIIAALLGIQTAVVGGGSFLNWLHSK